MTLSLVHFNTSAGPQPAIADDHDGDGNTLPGDSKNLVVFSQVSVDGLVSGQMTFKNGISHGSEPGTYC